MSGLFAAWAAELALVSWRSASKSHRPPLPSEVASTVIIFGLLGLVAEASDSLATVTGWGLVVATALNVLPTMPGAGSVPKAGLLTPGASPQQNYASIAKAYPGLAGPGAVIPQPQP